jgi:hypothetical protein
LHLNAAAGIARLEFALGVCVLGLIAVFALQHIASLQVSAHQASAETSAAQVRALQALAQACSSASSPTPLAGAASSAFFPPCMTNFSKGTKP